MIGDLNTRLATYHQARDGARRGAAASVTQGARSAQVQKQFDIGQVDRLDLTLARIEAILTERRAQAGHVDAQRALGALEDALQAPLSGGPVPTLSRSIGDAGGSDR